MSHNTIESGATPLLISSEAALDNMTPEATALVAQQLEVAFPDHCSDSDNKAKGTPTKRTNHAPKPRLLCRLEIDLLGSGKVLVKDRVKGGRIEDVYNHDGIKAATATVEALLEYVQGDPERFGRCPEAPGEY